MWKDKIWKKGKIESSPSSFKKKKKRRKLDNKQRENEEMVKGRNNFLVDERSTCAYYDINKRKSNSGIDYDRL